MSPDDFATGSPDEWLSFARADLAMARAPLPPEGRYELLCFHAQQAAEKAIKAVLVGKGIDFPRTHSIQGLLEVLPLALSSDPVLRKAVRLTPYATLTRYPYHAERVGEQQAREAADLAAAVLDWAANTLAG